EDVGLPLAHRARLLHGALRAANDILLLERLDPETRREIREIRNDGDEWPIGIHGRPGFSYLLVEVGNDRNQQVRRMLAKVLGEQAHHRPVKEPNSGLENTQELGSAQRPAIAQKDVVLLLDADAGQFAENIQLVGNVLELSQFDLPRALLLGGDGLKGQGGVTMATPSIMKKDVDFFHWGHCYMVRGGPYKSTHNAMWKTQKLICAQ